MACLRIVAAIATIAVNLTVSTPASPRDEVCRFFEEFEPNLRRHPRSAAGRHAGSKCSWRSRSGRWLLVRSRNSLAYPHPKRKQAVLLFLSSPTDREGVRSYRLSASGRWRDELGAGGDEIIRIKLLRLEWRGDAAVLLEHLDRFLPILF